MALLDIQDNYTEKFPRFWRLERSGLSLIVRKHGFSRPLLRSLLLWLLPASPKCIAVLSPRGAILVHQGHLD